jgi:hypothetical protein
MICRKKVSRFGSKSNGATLSAAHKKAQGGYASIRKIDAFGRSRCYDTAIIGSQEKAIREGHRGEKADVRGNSNSD